MKHFYWVALWMKKENLARYENFITLTVYTGKGWEKQIFPRQEMEKEEKKGLLYQEQNIQLSSHRKKVFSRNNLVFVK